MTVPLEAIMAAFNLRFSDNSREPVRIEVGAPRVCADANVGDIITAEGALEPGNVGAQLQLILGHPRVGVYCSDMEYLTARLCSKDGTAAVTIKGSGVLVDYQVTGHTA